MQFNNGVIRDNDRPVGKRERANWSNDHRIHRREDDGAAGREIVGGGSGGRGNYQAVSAEGVHKLLIEISLDFNNSRQRRFVNDHIVQDAITSDAFVSAHQFDRKHDALIETIVTLENRFERRVNFFDAKLGKVTQPSIVDPEYRHLRVTHQTRGGDHCAVASQHQYQISSSGKLIGSYLFNRATSLFLNPLAL